MKPKSLLISISISIVSIVLLSTLAGMEISGSQPQNDKYTVALWHLNEGVGIIANDETGANDGTIYGATWTTGKYGNALSFDGDDYVEVPYDSVFDITDEITLEAWIKPAVITQEQFARIVMKGSKEESVWQYLLAYDITGTKIRMMIVIGGTTHQATSTTSITGTSTWYHVCGTYNGTNLNIYVNGTLEDTTLVTGNINVGPQAVSIGGDHAWVTDHSFKGIIDEVRVSSIARTSTYGPTAFLTYLPGDPYLNEPVTFNAANSLPGWNGTDPSQIVGYEWNFGDTNFDTGMIVNHTYTSVGQYNVTLTVTDEEGFNDTTWETLDVLGPVLRIIPPTYTAYALEESFEVNVSIIDIADVCGWEFKLYYNSTVLNGTVLAEGSFLALAGSTYLYVHRFTDTFNATHGLIHAACTLIGPGPGASGNGTLTTITFKTKNPGDTPLHLQDTIIIDSNENPIPHTTQHGTIHFPIALDVYTQKGGIGLGKPSDAFTPGSTIILYGRVIYNEAPLPGILVQFKIYDPLGNPTIRTATTNQDGLATSGITLSSTCLFGNYTLMATTEIQQKQFNDTAPLKVGWIVCISQVTCCDKAGCPQTNFARDKIMYSNITLESIALGQRQIALIVDVTDELGNHISYQWMRFMIPPGRTGMIIGFRIPTWSIPGAAQLRVDAYANLPWSGGTIYCPGETVNFTIMSG